MLTQEGEIAFNAGTHNGLVRLGCGWATASDAEEIRNLEQMSQVLIHRRGAETRRRQMHFLCGLCGREKKLILGA